MTETIFFAQKDRIYYLFAAAFRTWFYVQNDEIRTTKVKFECSVE